MTTISCFALMTFVLIVMPSLGIFAQDAEPLAKFNQSLTTASTSMGTTWPFIRNILYIALGLVAAIILPQKVSKMQDGGSPEAKSAVMQWGGGLVFAFLALYAIGAIFFTA